MSYNLPKCGFKPETALGRFGTKCLRPFMRWLSGASLEEPQSTHFWNNHKISRDCFNVLKQQSFEIQANQNAVRRYKWKVIPIFHLPKFGGWKDYVVLEPAEAIEKWFVGWGDGKVHGISRIPQRGPVRVLKGSRICNFVGVDSNGMQLRMKKVGCGQIGDGGKFCLLPLH